MTAVTDTHVTYLERRALQAVMSSNTIMPVECIYDRTIYDYKDGRGVVGVSSGVCPACRNSGLGAVAASQNPARGRGEIMENEAFEEWWENNKYCVSCYREVAQSVWQASRQQAIRECAEVISALRAADVMLHGQPIIDLVITKIRALAEGEGA